MDEEAKRALDGLFAQDKQRKEQVQVKRDLEAEAQAKFVADFNAKRDDVIIPAMRDFAAYIAPHGWTGELEIIEDAPEQRGYGNRVDRPAQAASAHMIFYRGATRPGSAPGRSVPHFRVSADKRGKSVFFHENTIGPNHGGSAGGSGSATLDELTAKLVQDRMVKYFTKLMGDAKPYDER